MNGIVNFFTSLIRRYMPDSFAIVILLTCLVMILAIGVEGNSPVAVVDAWGNGFWGLLSFTTQMSVILAMGYVLATAPIVTRGIDRIVARVTTPGAAIVVATLAGGIGSYLNWGFGLVLGGIVARKLAVKVRGLHYPLVIAAAYSGFTLYGYGLSSSVPLLISTPGHPMESAMGIIPLSETIFAPPVLLCALAILIVLPIVNVMLHPRNPAEVVEISPELRDEDDAQKNRAAATEKTIAETINNSRLVSLVIGVIGLCYVVSHFVQGGSLDLNMINFIILFLGILLHRTPAAYVAQLTQGISTISGIILQFPFYAGIMAVMHASGLVQSISHLFIEISTAQTLPFWGLVSSFVINFFAPSGGGHWVIQGPFMIDAAKSLGSALNQNAMAVQLGNAWNDLVQPFWILPALALSKLRLRDIMGYTVILMFIVGAITIAMMLLWGYFGQ
ncbi:short-chain fatty acid transporter [Acidimangrovimonas sediminis]|uniref:short-chain fatty acid transporter n=1 Tax=Acidimangrovimonas sediminis TaxID=2056283 RepID=UPI000C80B4C2|nr:TIGR00366 family protein [Acidimangrovimonas sediminis]